MDDDRLRYLAALGHGRRLARSLWEKHYRECAPDWEVSDNLLGVIHQISNMTAGLVKPERVPYSPPNFRERMETFFRRHDMDDKQPGKEFLRGDKWDDPRQQLGKGIHPAPTKFSDTQLSSDPILQFFHYAHLPPTLQPTSAIFCRAARYVVDALPRNAERTVALRKLLEAKDAAVRANVEFTQPAPIRKETFLDRLQQENRELLERKAKLWDFITSLEFAVLDPGEQSRLRRQHTAMDEYAQILIERLAHAGNRYFDNQPSASDTFEQAYERAQQTRGYAIPAYIQSEQNSEALKLRAAELERKHCTCGESKAACPVHEAGEQIDENVRITGGGKSEEPLPFSD